MRIRIALFLLVCFRGVVTADDETARHKERMDAAQDLKDDLKDALDAKSAEKSAEPAKKLVELAQQEEEYWKKTKSDDVLKLARQNLADAKAIQESARKGQFEAAQKAYGQLEASCRACHDLHPEKRKR